MPFKKIIFIIKANVENLPPILPRIISAKSIFEKVVLICTGISPNNQSFLKNKGIDVLVVETGKKKKGLLKALEWLSFKNKVWTYLKQHTNALLYMCSADAAISLGRRLFKKQYIFQCNELYDDNPFYKRRIGKIALNAKRIIVPEINRANIMTVWYGLKTVPVVVPNYPLCFDQQRNQPISNNYANNLIENLKNKKIIIYQGHISLWERDLRPFARALSMLNKDYAFVLMGRNHGHSFEKIKEIYQDTFYIPEIPSPYHLEVTSHAYIGLLIYNRTSLNNIFCAPNKIYEYACFGIPMIGNDIPGLLYPIDNNFLGKCSDINSVESIANSLSIIEAEYEHIRQNVLTFYKRETIDDTIKRLFKEITKNEDKSC